MPTIPQKRRKPPELPAAENAEKLILGSVLIGAADFADVAAALTADDFILEVDRRIFGRMAVMHGRGEPIDRPLLAQELSNHHELEKVGGLSYLVSLDDGLPHLSNLDGYIRQVRAMSVRRRALAEAYQIQARLQDLSVDLPVIQTDVAKLAETLTTDRETEAPSVVPSWPEPIREAGFHGLAGEFVRLMEPHTEADNAALLIQFLIGWGSLAGRGAYYQAEADYHHTNEYAVIVGVTAKGRKGTSWGRVRGVLRGLDEHWADARMLSGIGSGEALIDAVAEEDHRTLVIEAEFARLLAIITREGTTISAVLRDGWDSGTLSTRARAKKVQASGAHLSMLGHVTRDELRRRLSDTESANGFANRILWVCARRSKSLPHGGGSPDVAPLMRALLDVTDQARRMGNTRLRFDNAARELWETVYPELSDGKPGMLGAMTSRAEAHVVRLAVVYALLDRANEISIGHLDAALAVWKYCDDSARFIWGDAIGDAAADEILKALRSNAEGMTRTDIRDLFGRNRPSQDVDRALGVLVGMGLAREERTETGGRPATRWRVA
jgi:hypothetical protein